MRLIESFKKRKFILFNTFLTLYIGINLIGGERGLVSYFDKKNTYKGLIEKEKILTDKLKKITLTKASEAIDSNYRSRVISVVGSSNKFDEGKKKTAILALVSAESKADVGNVLEALLNGRKIVVPGLEKKSLLNDARSGVAGLPTNVRSLLKSLKESTEQEVLLHDILTSFMNMQHQEDLT